MITNHSQLRNQQRCIPPIIHDWLSNFGEERYDGHGGIKIFFSQKSIKRMGKEFGHNFVCENKKYFSIYRVESSSDGTVITTGWKTKRFKK